MDISLLKKYSHPFTLDEIVEKGVLDTFLESSEFIHEKSNFLLKAAKCEDIKFYVLLNEGSLAGSSVVNDYSDVWRRLSSVFFLEHDLFSDAGLFMLEGIIKDSEGFELTAEAQKFRVDERRLYVASGLRPFLPTQVEDYGFAAGKQYINIRGNVVIWAGFSDVKYRTNLIYGKKIEGAKTYSFERKID